MLDENAAVKRSRRVDRVGQTLTVARLGNADGRTEVGRLDKGGIADLALHAVEHGLAVLLPIAALKPGHIKHGQAAALVDQLHGDLVHTSGGAEHARRSIRHTIELQQTLNGAVLAIHAVEAHQRALHIPKHRIAAEEAGLFLDQQRAAALLGHQLAFRDAALVKMGIKIHAAQRVARPPAARHINVDGDDGIFGGIRIIHRLNGGNDRNIVLTGTAAVQNNQSHVLSHLLIRYSYREDRFQTAPRRRDEWSWR